MSVVLFDYNGTLTEKEAAEWKPLLEDLRAQGYDVGVVSASEMPEGKWNNDGWLGDKDFDFVIEDLPEKGRADVLMPEVEKAHKTLHENKQDMGLASKPLKRQNVLVVDDNRINTLLLKKGGLGTILFDEKMSVNEVREGIDSYFSSPKKP